MTDTQTFAEWVVLEALGHRRLAGYLYEQTIAGHGFLRLDIPGDDGDPEVTQLFNPTSIYAIHPTTEAIARHVAKSCRPEPVARWELPTAPTFVVNGQTVDEESYNAWVDEGRASASVDHERDYDEGVGVDLNEEGGPF
jgi:hypothetical protein